jgi:hypothetical protein
MTTIDVLLRPQWVARVGYRYDVILDGEVIVSRSRDPEYDAARVLRDRGHRGRFRTIDFNTGRPRMILDIEKAAKLRTVERDAAGPPTVGLYRPMSDDDKARARLHRTYQGRPPGTETVPTTGEAFKGPGGERGVARRRSQATSEPGRSAPVDRSRLQAHRNKA